jgi:hypothetical protein
MLTFIRYRFLFLVLRFLMLCSLLVPDKKRFSKVMNELLELRLKEEEALRL